MTTNSHDTELRQNVLIASCSRYENAERTVDFLSDYGFPAQKMSIVGRGLEGSNSPPAGSRAQPRHGTAPCRVPSPARWSVGCSIGSA
jgi:hypothetical protein